jgi:hypothetical protein
MATYEEYLAQGVDPITADTWARADAQVEPDAQTGSPEKKTPAFDDSHDQSVATIDPVQFWASNVSLLTSDPELDRSFQELRLRLGSAPRSAIGHDSTGAVTLHVDRAHLPERLALRANWADELPANMLGSAILAAYRAARDVQYEEAREIAAAGYDESDWLPPVPAFFPQDNYSGTPRPADSASLSEDIRAAHNRADRYIEALKTDLATGRPDESGDPVPRTILVKLDAERGMVGCEVNTEWLMQVAAPRIMDEFHQAVHVAKNDLDTAQPSAPELDRRVLGAELNELVAESLAGLHRLVQIWQ